MRKAVDANRIHLVDGKIDPEQADADWAKNTATPAGNGNGHHPRPTPPPRQPEPLSFDLNLERARDYHYKAERERIALEKEQGQILDAEETRTEIFRAVRRLRDALRIIAPRNAGMLATMKDAHAIERLIQGEIDKALSKLSADLRADAS